MPGQIKRIASRYLNDPALVTIEVKTTTAETIKQRYWPVSGRNKLDALTRILEAETFNAMLIFVRTKTATAELSEKLEARGYACAPLNGDIQQKQRERTVEQLKRGKLDIIVATDVAARGLDVERISHVLNYDIPYDTEAYVHRIGRTGRAGRTGDAILFVAPREKRMMQTIERATGQRIEQMNIPSSEDINSRRIERFRQRISDTIDNEDLSFFSNLIEEYQNEKPHEPEQIAAALAHLLQGDTPFLYATRPASRAAPSDRRSESKRESKRDSKRDRNYQSSPHSKPERDNSSQRFAQTGKAEHDKRNSTKNKDNFRENKRHPEREIHNSRAEKQSSKPEQTTGQQVQPAGTEKFRLEVGSEHGAQAANIVGAIANEAGIESQYIGGVTINSDHSFITLPEGMPKPIFKDLKKVWVCGQKLQISRVAGKPKTSNFKSARDFDKSDHSGAASTGKVGDHGTRKTKDRNDSNVDRPAVKRRKTPEAKTSRKSSMMEPDDNNNRRTSDGERKEAKDHKVRKDRSQFESSSRRSSKSSPGHKGGGKKGRLGLADETQKKSLKAKRRREDSVAINKKRIRSIKARRDAGSGSEYIPEEKVAKSKGKKSAAEVADAKL